VIPVKQNVIEILLFSIVALGVGMIIGTDIKNDAIRSGESMKIRGSYYKCELQKTGY